MKKTNNTILAIDPGLREFGFAVLSGKNLIDAGARSLKLVPREKREASLRALVGSWIEIHKPSVIVLEATHSHPIPWLHDVHRMTRRIERMARYRNLSVARYAPQAVRKDLLGNGWATKKEAAAAIVSRYPRLRVYLTQDQKWKERLWLNMFDAIALALHHQRTR